MVGIIHAASISACLFYVGFGIFFILYVLQVLTVTSLSLYLTSV